MRIAFVGKGGSGKSTLSALLIQALWHRQSAPILAIDADINQHLAFALGLHNDAIHARPTLGDALGTLKDLLRDDNPMFPSSAHMIKTTLPGPGSHLIRLHHQDPVLQHFAWQENDLFFIRTGFMDESDVGIRCFHAKTGAVELILNHLADTASQWVVVDMTAGADAFASGLFTRFDMTCCVVEPTLQSVSVFKQYQQQAAPYHINVKAVGNKISRSDDIDFLRQHCGDDLITHIPQSAWITLREQGHKPAFETLERPIRQSLAQIIQTASTLTRDWESYWHWGIHFHRKNALSWGNQTAGRAVEDLFDADFLHSFHHQTS